jgi:hypothetical protein
LSWSSKLSSSSSSSLSYLNLMLAAVNKFKLCNYCHFTHLQAWTATPPPPLLYLKLPTGNQQKLQNELNAGMTNNEPCPWRSDPMLARNDYCCHWISLTFSSNFKISGPEPQAWRFRVLQPKQTCLTR